MKIKRIGLPEQVRDSVFERMRKERARIAQRYRSEGNEEAMKIRAAADKEKTVILAEAYAEAEIVRGKAEAKATRTYSEAHQKDAPVLRTAADPGCLQEDLRREDDDPPVGRFGTLEVPVARLGGRGSENCQTGEHAATVGWDKLAFGERRPTN